MEHQYIRIIAFLRRKTFCLSFSEDLGTWPISPMDRCSKVLSSKIPYILVTYSEECRTKYCLYLAIIFIWVFRKDLQYESTLHSDPTHIRCFESHRIPKMHTEIIEPKTESFPRRRYHMPIYVETSMLHRHAFKELQSPKKPELNECPCCISCCEECLSEDYQMVQCPYEVRRPACFPPKLEARMQWSSPCTCTASRRCTSPPRHVGRNAVYQTRTQLESIMNEMSACCPVRANFVPAHQACRQELWMSQMRFRYLYKPGYREQVTGMKDIVKPKRFQCMYCEKSFGKSSHLRDHVRTHTGERPFRCSWCNKAFTQYSNLRTHMRIHTGEKPYSCKYCLKSFTQAVTLRSHLRTHINDEKEQPSKQ